MSSALAVLRIRELGFLRHASQNEIMFWVVAGLAVLGLLVWAYTHRRRRWF